MALVDLKRGKKSRFADAPGPPNMTPAELAQARAFIGPSAAPAQPSMVAEGWGAAPPVANGGGALSVENNPNFAGHAGPADPYAAYPAIGQAISGSLGPTSPSASATPLVGAGSFTGPSSTVATPAIANGVPVKVASPYESLTNDPEAMLRMANANMGGPIVHHPAGFVPVSTTTKAEEGVKLGDETKKEIDRQEKTEGEAEGAVAALVPQQVAAEATIAQYDADRAAQDAADQKALLDWQHGELNRYKTNVDGLIKDANNASVGDTHKWWNDKGAGAKFATGVSMALRGFAFGMGHGSDPMKWMDDQINTSLDAQRQVADAAHNKANQNINEYSRLRQQFGDDATAAEAYKLKMRQNAVAQFQAAAMNQQLPEIQRLRASQMLAPLQKANVDQRVKLDELTTDKIAKVDTAAWQAARTTGGTPDILTRLHRALELKKGLQALAPNSPEEQKADADIAKLQAEALELQAKSRAGGPAATQQAEQEERLSKELSAAHIPAAKSEFEEANKLIDPKSNVLDGVSKYKVRGLLMTEPGSLSHAFAKNIMANDNDVRLANVIAQLADAKIKASGGRLNASSLPMIIDQIIGRGTPEDIRTGIAGFQKDVLSDEATLRAGVTPSALADFDRKVTEQRQAGGVADPTGVVRDTPTPAGP